MHKVVNSIFILAMLCGNAWLEYRLNNIKYARQAEAEMNEKSYKRMADKITELEGTLEQHRMAINGMGMAVIKLIEKENNTTY